MSKIGIPRTLAYFLYYPFWKIFFDELGHETVLSSSTCKTILDKGVREAVNDACIPIKIYHGHVADLVGKVDYIFTPRLVSLRKYGDFGTETFCPKFLGLPDMVRWGLDNLPPLIDVRIDLKKGKHEIDFVCQEVGTMLGNSVPDIRKAQKKATTVQKKFEQLLERRVFPEDAMDLVLGNEPQKQRDFPEADLNIAMVGYPYTIYDPYLNVGLLKILREQGVQVWTQDMLSNKVMNKCGKTLPKQTFWYFSNRAINGALYYMKKPMIDGIIHVTAFACGPDSVVDRLIEIETHRRSSLPFLSVTVDEHTAETGVRTRIEAFLDMLRYRREAQ
ncbi:MAG: acyl-CoA dehydratase activase-related protein [Bacillota bacterium]|nr:acyl-CoA dehydratase activase-related protein [Bacillota bacterium]